MEHVFNHTQSNTLHEWGLLFPNTQHKLEENYSINTAYLQGL